VRSAAENRLLIENELPPLPDGWRIERFRFLFSESKERNGATPIGDMLSVSEYRGVVPREYEHEEQRRTDQELENYRVVRPGQLAVNTMWLNHLGLGISDHIGHVSPAYAVYQPSKRLDGRFVHHLLRSQFYLKIYLRYLYGIRPNSFQIKSDDWKSIPVILPDLPTQKAIAAFLDRETARIDQLIEKKQRLVELLGERRRALLSDVVTGAFTHPNNLKPTGSGFVPQLPTHWRLATLKQIARVRGGITVGRKVSEEVATRTVPYMRVANVQASYLDLSDVATLEVTDGEKARYALKLGDVLMIEGGDNDKLGRGAVWSGQLQGAIHQNHVFAVRPKDRRLSLWISMCSNAQFGRDYFFLNSRQSTNLASVSKTRAERMPIPLPPIDEVNSTVDLWSSLEHGLANTVDKTSNSIDRLKEYRSALITAAVTGQIDVETWSRRGEGDRRLDRIEEEMAG
jgi:type I restriction enzyme S subunit